MPTTPIRTRALQGVAVVALATLATACGGSDSVRVVQADGRTALVQRLGSYGLDALIIGQVAVNDQGCFGLGHTDGSFHVAIWPPSFGLTADGQLRNGQGETLPLGVDVELGGGAERFEEGYPELAELCLGADSSEDAEVLRLQPLEG